MATPSGQRGRGFPSEEKPNPKTTNRRDSIGSQGDVLGQIQPGWPDDDGDTFSDIQELGERGNRKNKGSQGSVPDPNLMNEGYTQVPGSNRSTSSTSSKRIYPISPEEGLADTSGVPGGEQRQTPRGGAD